MIYVDTTTPLPCRGSDPWPELGCGHEQWAHRLNPPFDGGRCNVLGCPCLTYAPASMIDALELLGRALLRDRLEETPLSRAELRRAGAVVRTAAALESRR